MFSLALQCRGRLASAVTTPFRLGPRQWGQLFSERAAAVVLRMRAGSKSRCSGMVLQQAYHPGGKRIRAGVRVATYTRITAAMRTRIRALLILLSAASILVASPPSKESKIAARMDEIVRVYVENKTFAGSILVARDDQ